MNRFPSLKQFVVSGFPVSQYRRDLEARLNGEGERCLVLKPDVYAVILRREGQFHVGNDLAFDLREPENSPLGNFLSSAGAGNFMVSQLRLLEWCGRLGARSWSNTNASRCSLMS